MNRTKGVIAAALLFAGMSLFARDAHRAFWYVTNVQTGRYDVSANWVEGASSSTPWGAVPSLGFWGCFDSRAASSVTGGRNYSLQFPEPTWENSHTQVRGLGAGDSLTFDSRNSFWFKSPGFRGTTNPDLDASYQRNYPFIFAENGTEGVWWAQLLTQGADLTQSGFMLTNGLLRLSNVSNVTQSFDLVQGELNWRDPLGSNTVTSANLQLGYSSQDQDATTLTRTYVYNVHEGASLRGRTMTLARGTLNVSGGVDLSGSLTVGAGNVANAPAAMNVQGGDVVVRTDLTVGAYAKNADVTPTTLTVGGDAHVVVTNLMVSTSANAKGLVRIGDMADVTIEGLSLGATAATETGKLLADVRVGDTAAVTVNKSFQIATASKANARLTLEGNASVAYRNNHALELGIGGRGELILDGHAVLTNSGPTYICGGTGVNCQGEMTIKGSAIFRAALLGTNLGNGQQFYLGYYKTPDNRTAASKARLTVTENAVMACNSSGLNIYGPDSVATLESGTTTFYRGNLYGGAGLNSGLIVKGGTNVFSEESRLGGEVEGRAGYNAFLRQEGGTLTISKGLHVADYGSTGRVELVGGFYRGPITSAGEANARAEFYANGGTYVMTANSTIDRLSGFEDARVGAKGLFIQMGSYSAPVEMAFADASDAAGEGLVTVIGSSSSSVLTANATATHAKTLVSKATLLPGVVCASFGQAVTVADDGVLSLAGAVSSFSASSLQLGSATGKGTLKIDAGDVVTLTGAEAFSAPNGAVAFASAPANGTYTVFRCKQPLSDPAAVLAFRVEGLGATQRAALSWKTDEADTLVQVTVYTAAETRENVWQGASAAWNEPDSWSAGMPGPVDSLVFDDRAVSRQVTLPDGTTLKGMTFSEDYVLDGAGAIRLETLAATAGQTTVDVTLATTDGLSVEVAKDAKFELDGRLVGTGTVTKDGSGELDVNAENPDLLADWNILLGRTVFAYLSSVGGDAVGKKLTLGPGTVQFDGAGTLARDVVVAAGTDKAAIVDCRADVTFDGSYNATSGGFVKIGPGALSFNVTDTTAVTRNPSKAYLAYSNPNGGEYYPSKFATEDTVFDPCGDFGTMTNSLGGFNVLDGRMTITGSGKDLTKYQQNYWTVIGGRYPAQQAEAELELRNLYWSNNSNYRRMAIGAGTCEGCPQHPTLRILDGSYVNVDGLFLGMKGSVGECHPTLAVTNSTVVYRHLHLGENAPLPKNHPTMRLGAGADIFCDFTGTDEAKGLWIRDNTDVIVSDGGVLAAGSGAAAVIVDQYASGRLRFENGGTLKTPRLRGSGGHNASVSNLVFQFDAGVLQFVKPDCGLECSVMMQPAYHFIEAAAGGLEIRTDESVSHTLAIPVTGPGKMRKTGPGELVLAEGCRGTAASHPTLTGLTTADWQGGTEVAEGVLTLQDGCVTNTAMSFAIAEGAALNLNGDTFQLGTISGGGVVSNGTLTCGLSVPWDAASDAVPTFDHVTGVVTVDFNAPQEATGFPKENIVVARLAPGTAFTGIRWKGVNKGKGIKATFAVEDGVVMAKLDFSGVLLIVR